VILLNGAPRRQTVIDQFRHGHDFGLPNFAVRPVRDFNSVVPNAEGFRAGLKAKNTFSRSSQGTVQAFLGHPHTSHDVIVVSQLFHVL
jgi:hypothetical protein